MRLTRAYCARRTLRQTPLLGILFLILAAMQLR